MLFPEVDALYGVPQRADFHPEIDTGVHVEMVLDMAARLAPGDDLVGWCALTHDLGKALTPADVLPRHIGHEHAGVAPLRALSARLSVPAEHLRSPITCAVFISISIARSSCVRKRCSEFSNASMHSARPERVDRLLIACEADKRGRLGSAESTYPQAAYVRAAYAAAAAVNASGFVAEGLKGEAIGEAMRKARVDAIAHLRAQHRDS